LKSQLTTARGLLIVTASVEMPIAALLLASPPLVARLILGASFDSPAATVVGRVGGAALVSLSAACWLSRNDAASLGTRGLITAMLLYNCAAGAVLANAAAAVRLVGVLLWPAFVLHAFLAMWCVASLRGAR
jgi:hypothetical protein